MHGIFRLRLRLRFRLRRLDVGQIVGCAQGRRVGHHLGSHVLGIDRQQIGLLGVDDPHIVDRALIPAVLVGYLIFLRHPGLEVLPGLGLLHVVDHLFKIGAVLIEVLERLHHHAGAVVVVRKVDVLDLLVGHGKILPHQLLVGAEISQIIEHADGYLVIGPDQALVVRVVQGGSGSGDIGVRGQLPGVLQVIVIEIQRQLEGAGRHHHMGLVVAVGLAGDGIIVGQGEIVAVQAVLIHKIRHGLL